MKRFHTLVATALILAAPASFAGSKDLSVTNLVQKDFRLFSEDLSSALSYKAVAPAEPLGITGFDIGLEVTSTKMGNSKDWATAVSNGKAIDNLSVPKLHLHKGLPLDLDVGVVYTSVPTTNIKLIGGELRYAIVAGNVALPAVAVRGTMTKLSGVDQLAFNTKGLELTVSKGFAMLTPYAGVGNVWTTSDPSVAGLKKETFTQGKYYLGANLNLGLTNLAFESDKTGKNSSISAKLGFRW